MIRALDDSVVDFQFLTTDRQQLQIDFSFGRSLDGSFGSAPQVSTSDQHLEALVAFFQSPRNVVENVGCSLMYFSPEQLPEHAVHLSQIERNQNDNDLLTGR